MSNVVRLADSGSTAGEVERYGACLTEALTCANGEASAQRQLNALAAISYGRAASFDEFSNTLRLCSKRNIELVREQYRNLERIVPPEPLRRAHKAALNYVGGMLAVHECHYASLQQELDGDKVGHERHQQELGSLWDKAQAARSEMVAEVSALIERDPETLRWLAGVLVDQPSQLKLSC